MSASRGWGGGRILHFLGGKSCDAFVHGVVIVVAFENLFTLRTCFQVVFKYFIAQGFSDRSAQFL